MHSVVDFTSPLKDIDTRFTPTICSPKAGEESGRKQYRRGTQYSYKEREAIKSILHDVMNTENKRVQYDPRDPIFQLVEEVKPQQDNGACISCERVFVRSTKVGFCKFCGKKACVDCLKRKRAFPKSELKWKRGGICFVCEQKFYIHSAYQEYGKKFEILGNLFCFPERSLISLFSIADSHESKLRLDVEEKDIKHSKVLLDTELLMQKVIDKQDQIRNLEETLQFEIDLLNQETEKLHKERETFFRNGQKKGEENR